MMQMSEGIIAISDLPDELVEYFRKDSVDGSSLNCYTSELETLIQNDPYAVEILKEFLNLNDREIQKLREDVAI